MMRASAGRAASASARRHMMRAGEHPLAGHSAGERYDPFPSSRSVLTGRCRRSGRGECGRKRAAEFWIAIFPSSLARARDAIRGLIDTSAATRVVAFRLHSRTVMRDGTSSIASGTRASGLLPARAIA